MGIRVLAVLGTGLVDPAAPLLRADDLGVVRGDGVFETMLVRNQSAWLREEHLARLASSASRMDLELPPLDEWRALIDTALAAWPDDAEGVLRLVCTRGPEDGGGPVTGFVSIAPVSATTLQQRRDGVRVITCALGVSARVRAEAPWLLGGVKSTSYATNMAALRHAQRSGADDVIYVSAEGELLEGPTATVVWAVDNTLTTVPTETGILAGTTAAHLLGRAPHHGFAADVRHGRVDDLHAADGVWLVSSVRGAVPVRAIDGHERDDGGLTERVRAALGLA